MHQGCRRCPPTESPGSAAHFALLAEPGSTSGRSVVVAAAADGVSHPSHQHQCQADDEEDDPDDQANMSVGEGRDEGREEEPEDDKEDSEADHDVYLVSVDVWEEDGRVSVGGRHLAWCSSDLGVFPPDRRVFRCAAGHPQHHAYLTAKGRFRMCGASKCSSSSAAYSQNSFRTG